MMLTLTIIGFIAYFIESIFGFGGTIILIAAAGLFHDVDTLIILALVASASASAAIMLQSWRQVNWPVLGGMLLTSGPGIIVGALLVGHLPDHLLLHIFALILIVFGLLGMARPVWRLPRLVSIVVMLLGGIAQGLFATGGPLVLLGYRDHFADKRQLRATMAGFFLLSNIWRFGQFSLQDAGVPAQALGFTWIAAPVMLAVLAGYWLHLRLSDRLFRIGLNGLFVVAGVLYLLR